MKLNKTILALSILAGAATACTYEWDNHYEVGTPGEGTIWQVISSNESLSNFKAVLEATGYEAALNGSQIFTVFAPTNSELTDEMRDQLIEQYKKEKEAGVKEKKNSVIKEFVQNHISLYNYSVAPSMSDTTINMMNGKHIAFTKSSFAGNEYLSQNVQTGNGVLFTIGKVASYEPSVYERLSKDADLDSVWNYISGYTIERFHSESSVPGEIIDGKTHYLDSVTVTENSILNNWLDALIDNEDSTYWMLAPTNEVWKSELERNETYFQYDEKIAERDSFMYHYPRINMIYGTIFSRSQNAKIFANNTAEATDSLMSTNAVPYILRKYRYGSDDKKYYQYDDPFGKNGILTGTDNFECSNGRIMKASEWKINPLSSFVREIVMEGESSSTVDSLNLKSDANRSGDTSPVKYVNVTSDNPFYNKVSNNRYLEITPLGANNFSKALFDVRGVLSNLPYDVYIVTAPAEAGDTAATEIQRLPIKFRCSLQCNNQKGNAYYINTKGEMKYPVYKNDDVTQGAVVANYYNSAVIVNNLTTTPGIVDSVFVGTYTFPTCSYHTSEAQVKLIIDSRVSNTEVNQNKFNRTLRLDCIVFKPHVE